MNIYLKSKISIFKLLSSCRSLMRSWSFLSIIFKGYLLIKVLVGSISNSSWIIIKIIINSFFISTVVIITIIKLLVILKFISASTKISGPHLAIRHLSFGRHHVSLEIISISIIVFVKLLLPLLMGLLLILSIITFTVSIKRMRISTLVHLANTLCGALVLISVSKMI